MNPLADIFVISSYVFIIHEKTDLSTPRGYNYSFFCSG